MPKPNSAFHQQSKALQGFCLPARCSLLACPCAYLGLRLCRRAAGARARGALRKGGAGCVGHRILS